MLIFIDFLHILKSTMFLHLEINVILSAEGCTLRQGNLLKCIISLSVALEFKGCKILKKKKE